MKPKAIELIPIYGAYKYFKRYFSATKRTAKEALIADWVNVYHMIAGVIFTLIIVKWLF